MINITLSNLTTYTENVIHDKLITLPITRKEFIKVLEYIKFDTENHEIFVNHIECKYPGIVHHLNEFQNVNELNYLALKLSLLSDKEIDKLTSLIEYDISIGSDCSSIINAIENLNHYELLYDVKNVRQYGIYLYEKNGFEQTINKILQSSYNLNIQDKQNLENFKMYFNTENFGLSEDINQMGGIVEKGYLEWDNTFKNVYKGIENIPGKYIIFDTKERLEVIDLIHKLYEKKDISVSERNWFLDTDKIDDLLELFKAVDVNNETHKTLVCHTYLAEVLKKEELDIVEDILYQLKIYDIELKHIMTKIGDKLLIAKDENNIWRGKDFYNFLLLEAIHYESDGSCSGIKNSSFDEFKRLAYLQGATIPLEAKFPPNKSIRNKLEYLGVIKSIYSKEKNKDNKDKNKNGKEL